MAIGTPTVGTFTEFSSSASNAVPHPASVGAGDCLVLLHTTKLAGAPVTSIGGNAVTGTAPNQTAGPWTVIQRSCTGDSASPSLCIAIKPNAAGTEGGTNLTVAHTTGISSGQVLSFAAVDTTTPQDVAFSSVNNTGATTTVIPGVTIATAGAALVAAAAKNVGTVTATPPSGFTETGDRVSGTASVEFSYLLGLAVGATGNETVTWSSSTAITCGVLIALRPAIYTGTLAVTDSDDTLSAAGLERFLGTLALTDDADTLAGVGVERFLGTVALSDGNDTLAAVGTSLIPAVTGTLAVTDDPDTLAATGLEKFLGTLASSDGNDTLAATGSERFTGTLTATDGDDTLAAAGTSISPPVTGSLAVTDASDTCAATGSERFVGTLAASDGNDTLAASGTSIVTATGTLAITDGSDTLAALGVERFLGTLAATETNDTLAAVGIEIISGTLAVIELGDTLFAVGIETMRGSLSVTDADDTLAAAGNMATRGTIAVTDADDTLHGIGRVIGPNDGHPTDDPTLTLVAATHTLTIAANDRGLTLVPVAHTLTIPGVVDDN